MQSVQIILEDAPENIHIPSNLQHQKLEVTFKVLDTVIKPETYPKHSKEYIDSVCGVLQSSKMVSIEEMDNAIRSRGGKL